MCLECGCGDHSALVCPECGGRVILINEKAKCLSCGASPSLEVDAAASVEHEPHHVEHAHEHGDVDSEAREELVTKLSVLLPHWIEHNVDHAESFCTWAEQARAAGAEHLAAHIEEAVRKIEAANRDLEHAIEHIGASDSGHGHRKHQHVH